MDDETRRRVAEALEHCRQAREQFGAGSAHRTRVLLDMTIHALVRELVLLDGQAQASAPGRFGETG